MPRKKREIVDAKDNEAVFAMTKEELFRIRAMLAEGELAQVRISLALAQKREILRKVDPEGKLEALDSSVRDLAALAAMRRAAYNAALQSAGDRLGLDISKCAWDDETGDVKLLE